MEEKLSSFSHQEEAIQAYGGQVESSLQRGADPFMRSYRMRLPMPEEMVRAGPIGAELASELGMPEFSLEYLQAAAALRVLDRLAFIEQMTQEELSLARSDLVDARHELAELRGLVELANHRVEEHQVNAARLAEGLTANDGHA